jgi:hypothetical protein
MLRYSSLVFLVCLIPVAARSQTTQVCLGGPATTNKLICLIPGAYGPNGLVTAAPGTVHAGHFENTFVNTAVTPVSSAIATQSSLLPLASPSSGLTFVWDPIAKVFAPSSDSLGPILSERAQTIGRHRLFVGFGYQYFDFTTLDGLKLKELPFVFAHEDDTVDNPGTTCSISPRDTPANEDGCAFVRDVVKTENRIDLKIHQFTTFIDFGLTNRIEISAAIPVENVRMGVRSRATIVHNDSPLEFDHTFPSAAGCPTPEPFPPPPQCLQESFSQSSTASGIGDIIFRIKGTVWKGERAAVAVGAEVRLPTGDELNFLGSGAIGLKPFAVLSYRARLSPHVLLGYQSNESSVLVGDVSIGRKARLPGGVTYSGGVDIWIIKRLTATLDLVGQQVVHAQRLASSTFTELGACTNADTTCTNPSAFATPNHDPNLSSFTHSYNITNAALGIKAKPLGNFLIAANVTLKLNDGGLRSKAVPLIGVSYTF